jgi:superfamily II DNA/RNA helicase
VNILENRVFPVRCAFQTRSLRWFIQSVRALTSTSAGAFGAVDTTHTDKTMRFDQFSLSQPILRALHEQGYETATPIQQRAIPEILAGRDILGCAQTGTGKTAAFALPILQRLSGSRPASGRPIRVLVVTPTRELAAQIGESFRAYGRHLPLTSAVIFGGVTSVRRRTRCAAASTF